MKTELIDYAAIMEIGRRDKERRLRKYRRHVKRQNFAAKYGYSFWNRVFSFLCG